MLETLEIEFEDNPVPLLKIHRLGQFRSFKPRGIQIRRGFPVGQNDPISMWWIEGEPVKGVSGVLVEDIALGAVQKEGPHILRTRYGMTVGGR